MARKQDESNERLRQRRYSRHIPDKVYRALLAHSGNQCAFPECIHPIFNEKKKLIAQLCHIEAVAPGGPRYNEALADSEKNGYDNLLFLCNRHHIETDDITDFSVSDLKEMKANHERTFSENSFIADKEMIKQVDNEMKSYWKGIQMHSVDDLTGLLMKVDTSCTGETLFSEINETLVRFTTLLDLVQDSNKSLYDDLVDFLKKLDYSIEKIENVPYYENPMIDRTWEELNIGVPNFINSIQLLLKQIEVKYYEEVCKNPKVSASDKAKLEQVRREFSEQAQSTYHTD